MKVIRGTRDANGVTILRGGQGGLRKIRCHSCGAFAPETQQGDGSMAYVCRCGAKYKATPMK